MVAQNAEKDIAIGERRGIGKGRTAERTAMHKRLSKFAGQGMTPEQLQEIIDESASGGGQDGQNESRDS